MGLKGKKIGIAPELDFTVIIEDMSNRIRDLELEIESLSSNGKFLYSFYKRGFTLKSKITQIESDYATKKINQRIYEYKLINLIESVYEFKTLIEPFLYFDKLNYTKLMGIFEWSLEKLRKKLPVKFSPFLEKFF